MAKALVKTTTGAGGIEIQDFSPRQPGPGEVTIRVAAAGVCGTDLHIRDGEWPTNPPVVMGHELSGTVVACGPDVSEDWLETGVVSEVLITDGTCEFCLRGKRNLCRNRRALGRLADGAFTEYVVVPEVNLHKIPDGVDLVDAALAEPLACVLGALTKPTAVAPGDRVLVMGPGTIGLLAAQVARLGGGTVTVAGTPRDTQRLQIARQLGFATIGDAEPVSRGDLEERFEVVIECSGAPAAANLALAACAKAGTYVQLGIFGRAVQLEMDQFCMKDLSFLTCYAASPRALDAALTLLAGDGIAARAMISRIAALDDWEDVFEQTGNGSGLKFLFNPSL